MPVEYRYDVETGCLLFRLRGHLNLQEFKDAVARAKADPDIPPGHLRFSDLRAILGTPNAGDVEEIARLSNALDEVKPPRLSALLADQDFFFGLARMFRAHREGEEKINIFRDYEAAVQWLGLPEETPDLFVGEDWR